MFYQRLLNASHIAGKILAVFLAILMVWWLSSTAIEVKASAQESVPAGASQEADRDSATLQVADKAPEGQVDGQDPKEPVDKAPEAEAPAVEGTEAETALALAADSVLTPAEALEITVTGYSGVYDGASHAAVTVNAPSGTTLSYRVVQAPLGQSVDNSWSSVVPTLKDAGEYGIEVQAYNPDYSPESVTASAGAMIDKAPLTITTGSIKRIYTGQTYKNTDCKVSGLVGGETLEVAIPEENTITNVGKFTNTPEIIWADEGAASGAKESNYALTQKYGTLEVTPIQITITPNNASKQVGEEDPDLTATITNGRLLNGDTIEYWVARTEGEAVGTYDMMVMVPDNKYVQGNYQIISGFGTFTIEGAALQDIDLDVVDLTKGWGDADPVLTASLVTGTDGLDAATLAAIEEAITNGEIYYTRALGEELHGKYPVTLRGPETINGHKVNYGKSSLTVIPHVVTVSPAPATKVYGDEDPVFEAVVDGQLPGHPINYTLVRRDAGNDNVNSTHVIAAEGEEFQDVYQVVYGVSTLTVTPKEVTVTANAASKYYGESDNAALFTAEVEGLIDGDSIEYTFVTTAGRDAGTYTVLPTGAATQGNYEITYIEAPYTILPKHVVVTADDRQTYEGSTNVPTWTATVSNDPDYPATIEGLVGDDRLEYTVECNLGTTPGTYEITVAGAVEQGNYVVAYKSGTCTVLDASGRTVIITPQWGAEKTYGQADPTFAVDIRGYEGAEPLEYTVTRTAGENVGDYSLMVTGPAQQNGYNVVYETAVFTINPASIGTYVTLSVAGSSSVLTYDGQAHAPYEATVVNARPENELVVEYSIDGENWTEDREELAKTHAGIDTVQVRVSAKRVDSTQPANYAGTLTDSYTNEIAPRKVTLTSADGTKVYDGTPLVANEVYNSGAGFVEGEGVECYVTGTRTEVGTSENTFSYTWKDGTLPTDYELTTAYGHLMVAEPPTPPAPEIPTTPTEPVNPTQPETPTTPTEPQNPITPTTPVNPGQDEFVEINDNQNAAAGAEGSNGLGTASTPTTPTAPLDQNEVVITAPLNPLTNVDAPEGVVEGIDPVEPITIEDRIVPLSSTDKPGATGLYAGSQDGIDWVPFVVGGVVVVLAGAAGVVVVRRRLN